MSIGRSAHQHAALAGMHVNGQGRKHGDHELVHSWDQAVTEFCHSLGDLETRCESPGAERPQLVDELHRQIRRVEEACRAIEHAWQGDPMRIADAQRVFRQRTEAFFERSYLMRRARHWPRGYPGDYETIEKTYEQQAYSTGLGGLLDEYFQQTTLARGIRYRRERMREILAEEMLSRQAPRVLNIGCGPCREVVELADTIQRSAAHFTCLDLDAEALVYSAERMLDAGIHQQVDFRQYNAVRLIDARRNIRTFGRFDIIYTIGLLDYLPDDLLVRLLQALFQTLTPHGVLVAVFKDADRYDTADYHWLVDWSAFLQRTAHDSWRLLALAGIPRDQVIVQRSQDDVMIFYRVLQSKERDSRPLLAGPHSRIKDHPIEPIRRHPAERPASTHATAPPSHLP